MPLTALIIDDEPLARQELQFLLDAAGDVSVLGQGSNGIEAVDLIRAHRPDVVFLDVRMPGLDGFAVLKKVMTLDKRARLPQVVFATAFDQYAVKAFEVNAVDYLLKPFDAKRVVKTLEKVRARIADSPPESASSVAVPVDVVPARATGLRTTGLRTTGVRATGLRATEARLDALLRMVEEKAGALFATTSSGSTAPAAGGNPAPRTGKVVLRAQGRLLLADQKDICFATIADGQISVITRTVDGESNCRTLDELMDQLDPEQFWRVHRSFVVNVQHIREVVPWFKSSYQLRMDDRRQTDIPVSRSQTRRLRELFNL